MRLVVGRLRAAQLARRPVRQRLAEAAVAHREGERPHPVVEGLAQVVDRQLLDAEQDQGVGAGGHAAEAHGPARDRVAGAGEAAPGEGAERLLQHRVREVHRAATSGRGEKTVRPPTSSRKGSGLKASARDRAARCRVPVCTRSESSMTSLQPGRPGLSDLAGLRRRRSSRAAAGRRGWPWPPRACRGGLRGRGRPRRRVASRSLPRRRLPSPPVLDRVVGVDGGAAPRRLRRGVSRSRWTTRSALAVDQPPVGGLVEELVRRARGPRGSRRPCG